MRRIGIGFIALGSVAGGVFDLIWGEFERAHQPIQALGDHIPGETVLAYITAVCLVAGGAALVWRRTERLGAGLLAVIYAIFAAFWLPRLVTAPSVLGHHFNVYIGIIAAILSQAIVSAALVAPVAVSRWVFGLGSISFGLAHLTNIQDNASLAPQWLPPGADFWVVLTGIAFVLAGVAVLVRVKDVLASQLLALMFLVFSVLALAPLPFGSPHDHVAWGANAYNLAAVGATCIFASMLRASPGSRSEPARRPRANS